MSITKKFCLPALALCAVQFQALACEACGDDDEAPVPVASPTPATPATAASPVRQLGLVRIEGGAAPSSLPTNLPTTIEGISGAEIERSINASDSEDALKYLPSLLVRKRYDGDYNHAVLSTRASGTGNSARSLVYADGILLSNLLGNGATFAPRWGLVTPEEIERVDVLYGPFSAAYAGNAAGAVVDFRTRMPKAFEAHVKAGIEHQPFALYGHGGSYGSRTLAASIGDRAGALSWWINLNRLDSEGQPLTFITKPVSTTAYAGSAQLTGAVDGLDKSNIPWKILGTGTQYDTVQDHAKLKLAYDITPALRASVTLGLWRNDSIGTPETWLRDAAGQPGYSGSNVGIDGRAYVLGATDFALSRERLEHRMAGFSLKQADNTAPFNWELSASTYDYAKDQARTALVALPAAESGGAGRLTDLGGTGWTTVAARGVLRLPQAHTLDFGAQADRYRYRQRVSNTADWQAGAPTKLFTAFGGNTALTSLYAQDSWKPGSDWQAMLGLRAEQWQASEGMKTASDGRAVPFTARRETDLSPKAALGWQAAQDLTLKLSSGRAVRYPTATELYQGGLSPGGAYVEGDPTTNPNLRAEKGWTHELAALWMTPGGQSLRLSLFHEDTRDALYSQSTVIGSKTVTSVQNIGRIVTTGVEAVLQAADLFTRGFDLNASITYADSTIRANDGFVSQPGDTVDRQQPRVPRWRASLLATYALTPDLSASFGARYSGRQFGTLNNSDTNGFAYMGFSKFFTTDVRMNWRITPRWRFAAGIDNLNNDRYWAFHPYSQRSYSAELGFDL